MKNRDVITIKRSVVDDLASKNALLKFENKKLKENVLKLAGGKDFEKEKKSIAELKEELEHVKHLKKQMSNRKNMQIARLKNRNEKLKEEISFLKYKLKEKGFEI